MQNFKESLRQKTKKGIVQFLETESAEIDNEMKKKEELMALKQIAKRKRMQQKQEKSARIMERVLEKNQSRNLDVFNSVLKQVEENPRGVPRKLKPQFFQIVNGHSNEVSFRNGEFSQPRSSSVIKNASPAVRENNMPSLSLKKLAFSLSSIKKGSTNLEYRNNNAHHSQSSDSLDKRDSVRRESRNRDYQAHMST